MGGYYTPSKIALEREAQHRAEVLRDQEIRDQLAAADERDRAAATVDATVPSAVLAGFQAEAAARAERAAAHPELLPTPIAPPPVARPDAASFAAQFGREHGVIPSPGPAPTVDPLAGGPVETPAPTPLTGTAIPPQARPVGQSRLKDVMANWKDKGAPGAFAAATFDPILAGRATDRGPMSGTVGDLASRIQAKQLLDAAYGTFEDLHPSPQLADIQAKQLGAAQEALSPIPRPLYGKGGAFEVGPGGVISNRPPGPVGTIGEARRAATDMAKIEAELGVKERVSMLPYAERESAWRQYQTDVDAAEKLARGQKATGKDMDGKPISDKDVEKNLDAAYERAKAAYKLRIAKVTETVRE